MSRNETQRHRGMEASVGRLPPHAIEAEQGVLGCLLLAAKEGIGACLEAFRGKADVFYDLRHQGLYEVLVGMWDKQEVIDLVTVGQRLKDLGQLEQIGGYAYLSSLMDGVPSAANLEYYVGIVREKWLARKMIQACAGAVARLYEDPGEVDAALDAAERDVLAASELRVKKGALSMRELCLNVVDRLEHYHRGGAQLMGLSSGFDYLDKMLGGFRPGNFIVFAARPSMGKTSLAMNVVEHLAVEKKVPVAVFSLEMTAEELVLRLLFGRARADFQSWRTGFAPKDDLPKLTVVLPQLSAAPIYLDDAPGQSVLEIRAKARRLHRQHGVRFVVVDYLQLCRGTDRRSTDRYLEIGEVSRGLKALAKELGIPVLCCAQLNRELEKEKHRKPRLSDLRESGDIEQDADVVAMLYQPKREEPAEGEQDWKGSVGVPTNLFVAKQRNGPTGDVELLFFKQFTRFESAYNRTDGANETE